MDSMRTQAKGRSRIATLVAGGTAVALALTLAGAEGLGAQTAGRVIYMAPPGGGKSRPTSGPPGRSWCSKGKR